MTAVRHPLRRFYGAKDLHFVTFSCYRRRSYLGTIRARNCFVQMLDEVRCRHAFALIGYVVMPEHVHLLMSEPPKCSPSKVLQVLKQKVSQSLGKDFVRNGDFGFEDGKLAPFWQRRFYDFNVWSEKKVREKLEYMHRNPVERKLVSHPKDWRWSSWGHYAKRERGLMMIDSDWEISERENPHP